MNLIFIKNHKISLIFLSSLSLFLLIYFILFISEYSNQYEKIVEKVKSQIILNDNKITKILNDLIGDYIRYSDSISILNNKYNKLYKSDGISFYILTKSDSLLFWSENSVPLNFLKNYRKTQIFNSGNGWYRLHFSEKNDLSFIAIYLIKHEFQFQNDYLKNNFHSFYNFSSDPIIILQKNGYDVYSSTNQYLFSLVFKSEYSDSDKIVSIIFLIFVIALILFIKGLYDLHLIFLRKTNRRIIFFAGFIFSVILLRSITLIFKIPEFLYSGFLFSPNYYAYSDFIPSIGDFLLHTIFILIIIIVINKHLILDTRIFKINNFYKFVIQFILLFLVFISYKLFSFTFKSLVLDSKIPLNLNDFFSLNLMSILSFSILILVTLSYFLITYRLCFFLHNFSVNFKSYLTLSSLVFTFLLFYSLITKNIPIDSLVIVLILVLSFGFILNYLKSSFSLSASLFYLTFFSLVSAYYFQKFNITKEKNNRIFLATQLSTEQNDPVVNFQFLDLKKRLYSDEILLKLLKSQIDSSISENILVDYISQNYLTGFWKKFDYQITICNGDDNLFIKPYKIQSNCFSFFENLVLNNGIHCSKTDDFFQISYDNGDYGYLGIFDFNDSLNSNNQNKVFIEIIPRHFLNYLGFPELLIDEESDKSIDIGDYSYAKYHNSELIKRVGRYFYNNQLEHPLNSTNKSIYFDSGGYNHLLFKSGNNTCLIISVKNRTYYDLFAPFSYIFIFYLLIFSIYYFLFYNPFSKNENSFNLRSKLQLTMVVVILFSFLSIGVFSIFYINNLNDQKNKDILIEKTHSVLVELEHKLSDIFIIDNSFSDYINDLLVKFSEVFFSDINLFDLNGNVIGSSRPQIFNQKLISEKMNPVAFFELSKNNNSFFIQKENIGRQEYLSAYIPLFNNQSNRIAFLNLPYFAKENDLKREISNFLVTYINIFVILIAVAIVIGFLISNYISRPLKIIMNKIGKLKLGGQNEKIDWYRDDEIGKLVKEYNRMIDEISVSAEMLARSEREIAWREMAKQVAHEIKNPLTPMKLGVQHIQRAWKEKVPDLDKRLDKFTQTMIDQIDTLSVIATEFSDFAKMPVTKKELFDISELIQNSIILFKNYENITISFQNTIDKSIFVFNDKEQLLRVFNNLLKNSVQAIGDDAVGFINIILTVKTNHCIIEISDNGTGISNELTDKIFSPNFTTKSGGMGLGLAIVKSIVENSGGTIHFSSVKNIGTTFTINLPLAK